MTDYPRFEPVKGAPDVAYRAYHGSRLVDLVFWLVDRWTGKARAGQTTSAVDPASGPIEVHERLPTRRPAEGRSSTVGPSRRLSPEEGFSAEFLLNSARTRKLQAGVLIAFAAILIVILAQSIGSSDLTSRQSVRHPQHLSTGSISRPQDDGRTGTSEPPWAQ